MVNEQGVGKRIMIWPLTHRGYFPDDTDKFIEDSLSGDVILIDGITAGDSMESVIRETLTGLPLQLR